MKVILATMLRGVVAYLLLLVVTRVIGRKMIAQMTFFDYAVAISFGALTANLGMGIQKTSLNAGIVIITFAVLSIITSAITVKSMNMRKLIDSEPIVIIARGELVKANLKKARMSIDLVNARLREKDVFNIMDVEYAIMETNGQFSVLLKANKQPLTPLDMNVPAPYQGLMTELIMDGLLLEENLKQAGKDQSWLNNELAAKGVKRMEDVFFAAIDSSGSLYISMGIAGPEKPGMYGIE